MVCSNKIPKKTTVFFVCVFLCVAFFITKSVADIVPIPSEGWGVIEIAESVSPEEAEKYYQSLRNGKEEALNTKIGMVTADDFVPLLTQGESSGYATDPEIAELARALKYDPRNIFEFIYNHIDYYPYFGSAKGSLLTLIDREGNDFDQAALMIDLLRESGFPANFIYGKMNLTNEQAKKWIGIDHNTAITNALLASSGIPTTLISSGVRVSRVWVKANINGIDYMFDPALKAYEYTPRINLSDVTGYDRIQFLDIAREGMLGGTNYKTKFNEENIRQKMEEYSLNLISSIQNDYAAKSVSQILGDRYLPRKELLDFLTTLPGVVSTDAEWTEVPEEYICKLIIQEKGINHTFLTPDIGTKRLTLVYSGDDHRIELRLDGELVVQGDTTSLGETTTMTLKVDHPYASNGGTYGDQTATARNVSGSTYAIISNFFSFSNRIIDYRQQKLSQYLEEGQLLNSEAVLGETLNLIGLRWSYQVNRERTLIAKLTDHIYLPCHHAGRMYEGHGNVIDINMALYLTIDKNNASSSAANLFTSSLIGSAMEHGVIEQTKGSQDEALSTVKLLQKSNNQQNKIFWADSSNYSAIRSQLQNYSSATLDYFQTLINNGYIVVVQENGLFPVNDYLGYGYIAKKGTQNTIMGIAGYLNGGYSSVPGGVDPVSIADDLAEIYPYQNQNIFFGVPVSTDPVDLVSGAFLYDRTDIAIGPLTFTRSYNSHNRQRDGVLGSGWVHGYDISAQVISNERLGLGDRHPVDMAPMLTAIMVITDIFNSGDNLETWMTSLLVAKWAVDRLVDNVVLVKKGIKNLEYVKLSDGSYSSPPGITTQLSKNSDGTYQLKERFGTTTLFNSDNKISNITDVDGNQILFTYDSGKLAEVQDSYGRYLNFSYINDKLDSVSDSIGRSVSFDYDVNNDLVSYSDLEGKQWNFTYDDHRMTKLQNPLGIVTAVNVYDALNRVKEQTVPRDGGQSATYKFYFTGFEGIEENPFGKQKTYYYDEKGRTVAIENEFGFKSYAKYDAQDHQVRLTNLLGRTTLFEYNKDSNLVKIINALSEETNNRYDAQLRLYQAQDPLGHTITLEYDIKHHLTKTTDAELNAISSTYFSNGQPKTTTDARGIITTYSYDNYNNLKTVQTAAHPVINHSYDAIGRIVSLTDQENATTSFLYDDRNLLLERVDPLGKKMILAYDDAGYLKTRTDRNQDAIAYDYTPSGKIDAIHYPNDTHVIYTYDLHDRLDHVEDLIGTTSFVYDDAHQVVNVVNAFGFAIGYEYYADGSIKKIIYPDSKEVIYTYDELNRLKTVTNWLGQSTTYVYDAAGRVTDVTRFNGTVSHYDYDNAGRLIGAYDKAAVPESTITSYSYILDGSGNRTQITKIEPLIDRTEPSDINFTYNVKKNRLLSAGGMPLTYDEEGQTATKGARGYLFDYEHRLTGVNDSVVTAYKYDAFGNRVEVNRAGVVTRYIYDASGNLLAEADASNVITKYFVHGLGLLAMITPQGDAYTYHFDGTGNTIAITDQSKSVVNSYAYHPYGQIAHALENIEQPFKFAGQYGIMHEPDADLYYMRARYYDPETRRFVSEDPIGFAGGDVNLYAYVGGNPVNYVDPSGNWAHIIAGGVIGAVSGATCASLEGENVWVGIGTGAVIGAVSAAIPGVGASLVATGSVAGFLGNSSSKVANNLITGKTAFEDYNVFSAAYSGIAGGIGGYAGGAVSYFGGTAAEAAASGGLSTFGTELLGSIFRATTAGASIGK